MLIQIAVFVAAALSSFLVTGERVAVQAGKSFCFFEDLKADTPWGTQFQSDEHEVKAVLRGPAKVIFDGKPEMYGSYSFKAEMDGRYSVCFENPSPTVQKISFNFLGAENGEQASQEKVDPIDKEIQELNNGLRSVENGQNFILDHARIHQKIAEKTNSRIRYWFLYQILLVAAAVVFEIMFLKSFFEKRRVV